MTEEQRKADRYLSQIRNADREITDLINQIDYLRYKASGATAIRYDKDHVQTSPEDMVCESLAEVVDLEHKLSARHSQLQKMRHNTEQIISFWSDNNAIFIEHYYLNRGSMTGAANIIGCSQRHIYRIKFSALDEFSKHL